MLPTISRALAESGLDPVAARALLRHVLGADDAHLIAHATQYLSDAQEKNYYALVARRKAGEPIAYITGMREFFSLEFKVTPAVLIPRPETEVLVEVALERIAAGGACRVLDLGTGSGCVAISIAVHRPHAPVTAIDSSSAALDVARANAARLLPDWTSTYSATPTLTLPHQGGGNSISRSAGPSPLTGKGGGNANGRSKAPSPLTGEGRDGGDGASVPAIPPGQGGNLNLWFVQSDWYSALAGQRFDVIVSNPPYVAAGDPHLAQGDLRFEPAAALVAGTDGLDCIRLIVAAAPKYLNDGGCLMFEHGYDQSVRCRNLLADAGYLEVFSRTDLTGIERVSAGRWSGRA